MKRRESPRHFRQMEASIYTHTNIFFARLYYFVNVSHNHKIFIFLCSTNEFFPAKIRNEVVTYEYLPLHNLKFLHLVIKSLSRVQDTWKIKRLSKLLSVRRYLGLYLFIDLRYDTSSQHVATGVYSTITSSWKRN